MKKWRYQTLIFQVQKFCLQKVQKRSVFGELQFTPILLNFKTSCCNLKPGLKQKRGLLLHFEMNYDVLRSNLLLLNKKVNFNKKRNYIENEKSSTYLIDSQTLCFSSYKNRKLKIKQSSIIYNTSARHEWHQCDTGNTNATRVRD